MLHGITLRFACPIGPGPTLPTVALPATKANGRPREGSGRSIPDRPGTRGDGF